MNLLHGIVVDGNRTIDSVPVIAAAACFANSPSRIYNVANLHLKESDRINDLRYGVEQSRLPCECLQQIQSKFILLDQDGIEGGVDLDAHADHRLIEALSLLDWVANHPITVSSAFHIAKSYPQFFDDLIRLGAKIDQVF